jgi:signal transduction histidine kinase
LHDVKDTKNISGPFGDVPVGIGTICRQATVGETWVLNGCVRILGLAEIYTLALFLFFAFLISVISYLNFRVKSLSLMSKISDELDKIRDGVNDGYVETDQPIAEISAIRERIQSLMRQLEATSRLKAFTELSARFAHDIRSPLSLLDILLTKPLPGISSKDKANLRSATQRINDIANKWIIFSRNEKTTAVVTEEQGSSSIMLAFLVDSVASGKRIEFRGKTDIQINTYLHDSYGAFINADPVELESALSNLVNNSIEAFPSGKGTIEISIKKYENEIELSVHDNGRGIPPNILAKLGHERVTSGKEGSQSGNGLGVLQVQAVVNNADGRMSIKTEVGQGTTVILTFPKVETPDWFTNAIRLDPNLSIVTVDDDQTVHQVWVDKFSEHPQNANLMSHISLEKFAAWFRASNPTNTLYLIDYEFEGEKENGLDAIEKLGIAKHSILVSSHYDDKAVRDRAKALGVKMIPKTLVGLVPVQ